MPVIVGHRYEYGKSRALVFIYPPTLQNFSGTLFFPPCFLPRAMVASAVLGFPRIGAYLLLPSVKAF